MIADGKDNVSQGTGRLAVWGIVTSLSLAIAYGQLLALCVWWPQLRSDIVNTTSLTPGEERDLSAFRCLVVECPGVVHGLCFATSIAYILTLPPSGWSGWRWGVTLLVSIAGAGITGMVILKMIIDFA
jgi:hypothetical protein